MKGISPFKALAENQVPRPWTLTVLGRRVQAEEVEETAATEKLAVVSVPHGLDVVGDEVKLAVAAVTMGPLAKREFTCCGAERSRSRGC